MGIATRSTLVDLIDFREQLGGGFVDRQGRDTGALPGVRRTWTAASAGGPQAVTVSMQR